MKNDDEFALELGVRESSPPSAAPLAFWVLFSMSKIRLEFNVFQKKSHSKDAHLDSLMSCACGPGMPAAAARACALEL